MAQELMTKANLITLCRILLSFVLFFLLPMSVPFIVVYLLCGISDMVDGLVARKTNTVSEFGSKLDTVADFIMVVVCMIKLFPIPAIDSWLYVWIAVIAFIKAINIASGFVVQKKFVGLHTLMNKITGVLIFALPLTLKLFDLKYSAVPVCAVATFAAIQEGHYIRSGRSK